MALAEQLLLFSKENRINVIFAASPWIIERRLTLDNLIANLDKLHTTELGLVRIKRNLNLQFDDVVDWCKDAVINADIVIGQGKNWYVYKDGVAITINAHSFTIITAHKIDAEVCKMEKTNYVCLNEFLYQAIYVPEGMEPPPRSIIENPEIFIYIDDFGTKPGDIGVVATQNRQIIGAAWTRIIPAFGHIDDNTPELAISIFPEFRGFGIGTKLMHKLFDELRENGYKQTSLSVNKENPAVRFYQRLGYEVLSDRPNCDEHDDLLMIKKI